jgi:4-amino-4-deoxy-L-arabinose transferase-like glycosyltransferase
VLTGTESPAGDTARSAARDAAAVLLLCVPLFLVGLGVADLDLKGEPREAVTAWEAIHSGDWLLPRLNGEALPEKPPLFPWLVALSTLLFGERSEWAVRLPSALAAMGAALAVWALGRRLLPARGGLLAAALFAGSLLAVSLGRKARVDMTLTLFVTVSILLFHRLAGRAGEEARPRARDAALFWLCLALGTLTKGPLGLVLPGIAILGVVAAERRPRDLLRLRPWPFAPLLLVVAGSWYVQGLLRAGGEFGSWAFLQENVRMFLGESEVHRHGPLYYLPYVFAVALPWSPLLPGAVARGFRGTGRWREPGFLLPFAWVAGMLLLFSCASAKRSDYLLPLLPGAALLVAGLVLEVEEGREGAAPRWWILVPAGLTALLGVAAATAPAALLVVAPERLASASVDFVSVDLAREFLARATARPAFLALGSASLLVAGLAPPVCALRGRAVRGLLLGSIGVAGAAVAAAFTALPAANGATSLRPFAEGIRRTVPESAAIATTQDAFRFQMLFYAGRRIPRREGAELEALVVGPERGWAVATGAWLAALPADRRTALQVVARERRPGEAAGDELLLLRAAGR